jgi:predicted ABC-type ATPase
MNNNLGVILLGTPGSGKSTFARNYIFPHNKNIKDFSTDDVSYRFTKDVKKFHPGSTELNLQYLSNYMQTGQNFIYDTTGSNAEGVYRVYKKAKKLGYKVIFILILIDLETSKKQNKMRGEMGGHTADEDYIDFVYQRQYHTSKDYLEILRPDGFYVVFNKDGKYKFYKFSDSGELLKRKVDKYVSFIKESVDVESEVDNIVDTMLDFIDEGEKITFKSVSGDMTYSDYLEKNSKYDNFKPVITSRGTTSSKFSIVYSPKDGSYDNLMVVMENMKSAIGRLGGYGWVLSTFRAGSDGSWNNEGYGRGKEVKIDWAYFEFSKPYQKLETDDIELPDEDELRHKIESFGIGIDRLSIGDYETELDFYSNSYDGSLSSEQFYDDKFERICDIFGFQSYDLDYQRAKVIFEH